MKISARNQIRGTVRSVTPGDQVVAIVKASDVLIGK